MPPTAFAFPAREGVSTVALREGHSEVLLWPGIGGAIAHYTWRGHDILRRAADDAIEAKNIRAMACYPLVPYSNRIEDGVLLTGEARHQLQKNFPPEPHSIHGIGWKRPWILGFHDAMHAKLTLTHTPDDDWPFACVMRQDFKLHNDALEITLAIENTDSREMPVGLGFHPFFLLPESLETEWRGMWEMGADKLPTKHVNVPAHANFRVPMPVADWQVDHCFTGWNRKALLRYGGHRVTLTASDACEFIVCYARGAGSEWIALEPVTNANNAFALAARGIKDTGSRVLAPQESFSITMTIHCTQR